MLFIVYIVHVHVYAMCPYIDPSGPPINLVLAASGPSTITASWSAPAVNPDVVTAYTIQCAPETDPGNILERTRIPTITSVPFYDLIPNTTYDCEVYTRSRFGDSAPAMASVSTLPRESKCICMSSYNVNVHLYLYGTCTLYMYMCMYMLGMDLKPAACFKAVQTYCLDGL